MVNVGHLTQDVSIATRLSNATNGVILVTEKKYESEKVTARKEIGVASVIGSAVGNIVIENGKASKIAYTTGSVNVATGDITVTPNEAASVAKKMTGKSKSACNIR